MPTSDLTNWQRLHPAMLLFGLGQNIVRNIFPFLVAGYVSKGNFSMFMFLIIGLVMLNLVFLVVRFFSYRYRVEEGKLVIHEGILSRNLRSIPAKRIHNINTSQHLVARMLGVVRLDIETAGGGEAEASLPTISQTAAKAIQEFVRREKAVAAPVQESSEETGEPVSDAAPAPPPSQLLHKMTLKQVFLAGATSNRVGAIAFGLILLSQYMELTGTEIMPEWIMGKAEEVMQGGIYMWIMGLLTLFLLMVGAWIFGIVTTLVRYYGFTLQQQSEDLKIKSGLFTVREYTMPRKRIQALRCVTTAIRRPLGFFHLQVQSAGHVGLQEQSRVESDMLTPLTKKENIDQFAKYAFPDSDWNGVTWTGVHLYTRIRQWLFLLIILMIIALSTATFLPSNFTTGLAPAFLFIPAIALSFLVAHLNWKQTAYGYDRAYVYIKSGFLGLRYWVIPLTSIQNLMVSQAPGQRSRNLATLHLDLAGSGGLTQPEIENIPLEKAWNLFHRFATPFPKEETSRS